MAKFNTTSMTPRGPELSRVLEFARLHQVSVLRGSNGRAFVLGTVQVERHISMPCEWVSRGWRYALGSMGAGGERHLACAGFSGKTLAAFNRRTVNPSGESGFQRVGTPLVRVSGDITLTSDETAERFDGG